ncbi:MAG: hypothetical protein V3U75_14100 [Methylococcaceae bacterium]
MKFGKARKIFSIVLFTVFSLSLSISADAASICKGFSKSKCGATTQCGWVKSYKTKRGTTVEAFCRGKRGSKTVKKKSATKKVSSNAFSKTKASIVKKSKTPKRKVKKTKS